MQVTKIHPRKAKSEPVMGRATDKAKTPEANAINPAWARLALHIQPKLTVSTPGDAYEQEAEEVADRVMQMPAIAKPTETPKASPGSPATRGELGGMFGTGQPIPDPVRGYLEPRLNHEFSGVRVHTDSVAAESAKSVRADAYTVGRDVVFGAGRYAPQTNQGVRLLAHELAHVMQNDGGSSESRHSPPAGSTLLARQTWGTAKTTAPPAKNESPGDVFRGKLKDEVALFSSAGVILDWIVVQRTLAGGATVTSFSTASLFSDAPTMKKLKPPPANAADLLPALQMLEYYGVIKASGPDNWDIILAPLQAGQTQQDVDRARFDQNRKDISAFQKSFEQRFDAAGHPLQAIAMQSLLDDSLAGGSAAEKTAEKTAETNLTAVSAELDEFVAFLKKGTPVFRVTTDSPPKTTIGTKTSVLLPIAGVRTPKAVDEDNLDRIEPVRTGTSPEVEARRKSIEARVQSAERGLFNAQAFHRFAVEMVFFLDQLSTVSAIKFAAGTYPRHGKFGEYAADMFPVINEGADGFYEITKAEQFVDDINKVAETGHPTWGKYAWQIVYNDATLQAKINAKYGPRMSSAPHHGPAPDKLHMHLDVRPLNVVPDTQTGYRIDSSDRVVLF
jgi:hypothetical protein